MKFLHKKWDISALKSDALFVWQSDSGEFGEALQALDEAQNGYWQTMKKAGNLPVSRKANVFFMGEEGVGTRVVVLTLKRDENFAEFAKALWAVVVEFGWKKCSFALEDYFLNLDEQRVFLMRFIESAYLFYNCRSHLNYFEKFKISLMDKWRGEWLTKHSGKSFKEFWRWLEAWKEGAYFARNLANTPGNLCTPSVLASEAKKMAKTFDEIQTTVLKEKDIKTEGMEALLAVAKGSKESPRFIVVEYKPKEPLNDRPYVLVGKGVTFDAGGISLKPAPNMEDMKFDMAGAAAVLGTMRALAVANYPFYVVALIPAVENLPSGNALKPGDVISSLSGKTIEVLNTDAEGRLILCDALTYAERYQPLAVFDLATLTGACVIALGSHRAGLFSNDAALSAMLVEASERVEDWVWKMPLDGFYTKMLKSEVADIANISNSREAGAATAAAFLSEFTKNYPWVHLDIAGVAWGRGVSKGATGRPVALLLHYFELLLPVEA